jgi:glutathione S-transferase
MTLQLNYFNARGLAETSRFILAIAEQPYTDFRYPLQVNDWSTYDFTRVEFDQDKADGKLKRSLDKLPFLTADGQVISQSKAVERYLARRFGMMGSNEVEAAQIDAICEYVRDFKTEYQKTRSLTGDEREAGMTKWFNETLPSKLEALNHIVGDRFAVGGKTSLADITLFTFLTQFFDNVDAARSATDRALRIRQVVDGVAGLSSVQKWISTRPTTGF